MKERSLPFYLTAAAVILFIPMLLEALLSAFHQVSVQRASIERSAHAAVQSAAGTYHLESELYPTAFSAILQRSDIKALKLSALEDDLRGFLPSDVELPKLEFKSQDQALRNPLRIQFEMVPPTQAQRGAIEAKLELSSTDDAVLILQAETHHENVGSSLLTMTTRLPKFSAYTRAMSAEGYQISLFTADGKFIIHSPAGTVLDSRIRQKIASSGLLSGKEIHEGRSGERYITFWEDVHGEGSGEYIALSMPERSFFSALRTFLSVLLLAKSVPLIAAIASAILLTRVLARSQAELLTAASAVGEGHRIEPIRTQLKEANAIGHVLVEASKRLESNSQALKQANQLLEFRIRERTLELEKKTLILEATLDSVDQGIVYLNADGRAALSNRRAAELLQARCIEDTDEWGLLEPEMRPSMDFDNTIASPQSSAQAGERKIYTFERSLPNGVVLEIRRIVLGNGTAVCSIADVTQRVRYAEELQRAREVAEAANCAKDEFLANMSHELRTPLNAVLGYADLLMLDQSLSSTNQERVRFLRSAGWSLLAVLNDVLDYAQVATGQISISDVAFNIREVISETISIVQPAATVKGLSLDVELIDDLPHLVFGDANRIRQVLINLLGNAIKFTHFGFVKLVVSGRVMQQDSSVVLHISVEDSGIGIPLDQQGAVFERFHQVFRGPDVLYPGSGLGLAISRQLVTLMGGRIWFQSSPEVGTTFFVTLVLPIKSEVTDQKTSALSEFAPLRRILLADDTELGRDVVAQLLQTAGAEVDCVENGQQAVQAAVEQAYDLIILDLNMPRMSGYEAARRIRSDASVAHIPLIACSASSPRAGWEEQFDYFLSKPVSVRAVRAMLDQNLTPSTRDRHPSGRPVQPHNENDIVSLMELVGAERVAKGLRDLKKQIHDILRADLTELSSADDIGAIAHAALTSARLFGLDELIQILRDIEGAVPEGHVVIERTSRSVLELERIREEINSLEKDLAKTFSV